MHACYYVGKEVNNLSEKTIAIRIDEKLHREIKIRLAETGFTLKDYILTLVKNDLKQNTPIKAKANSTDNNVSEESVKEAQKVLDFVNDIIRQQNGDK